MIADLRRETSGFVKQYDLCIIGGGAAGIAIAQSFAGAGSRVCLVESGGLTFEDDTQQLYAGRSTGQPVDLQGGRIRAFGGSTNHWGGRCAELSEAEVAERSWVPDSGWPLRLDELAPYYQRARKICGFNHDWGPNDDVLRMLRAPKLDNFTSAVLTQVWRFSPNTGGLFWNFGKVYYDTLQRAPNVDVLLYANLTKFQTNAAASHVTGITVQSLSGVSGTIAAKDYALCCSGVENPRLLLAGSDHAPAGLGNAHDLVGRYFMEHPRATAATLFPATKFSTIQDLFNEFPGPDGIQYQVGVVYAEQAQRESKLLNCSADFLYNGDPESGTTAAQDIMRQLRVGRWPDDVGTDVWRVIRDLGALGSDANRLLHHRHPLLPLISADIVVDIEQAPDRDSRVSLGTTLDALRMREVVIDWRLSDVERQTVRQFMLELGAGFARAGIGRLRLEPWVEETGASWKNGVSETYHYIGTTRMSPDPRTGVVDVNCGVHGVDNLFVGGSSVFPTAGHVNPTLTVTALALRLADHLRQRMAS